MKNQMFMGASTKQGYDIATKSREIIRGLIGDDIKDLAPAERDIVERIVHSTADPEYAKLVHMSADFVEAAMTSLRNKETILTDINMVKYGITQYEGEVECFIKNEEVKKIAKENSEKWSEAIQQKQVEVKANDNITLRGTEYLNQEETNKWAIIFLKLWTYMKKVK